MDSDRLSPVRICCLIGGVILLLDVPAHAYPCRPVPQVLKSSSLVRAYSSTPHSPGTNIKRGHSHCVPSSYHTLFAHLSRCMQPCLGFLGRTSTPASRGGFMPL